MNDVSERPQAQFARGFLESEERFRQIADALNDVVALSDNGLSRLYFVNAAYEKIWGRPRAELYVDPRSFLEGVLPEDRDRVREAILSRSRAGYDIEYRIVRPGGDQRSVWSRGFPVLDANGEVYRIASITEDITERVQVIESRERFVRGFTHDLKNPLGSADGFLSLLEVGVYGDMPDAQKQTIGRVRRALRSALDLVTQLLEIEHARSGQLAVERLSFDLAATTRETAEGFRAAAEAKGQTLVVNGPAGDSSIVLASDPARVRQILANLISNAVKYTPANGHIEVQAFVGNDDSVPREGRWAAVSVRDDGPGIPLAKQNQLFREFTRFHAGVADGSGIGLAISQQLARVLGAVIRFKDVPGGGSSFTLWLPHQASDRGSGAAVS